MRIPSIWPPILLLFRYAMVPDGKTAIVVFSIVCFRHHRSFRFSRVSFCFSRVSLFRISLLTQSPPRLFLLLGRSVVQPRSRVLWPVSIPSQSEGLKCFRRTRTVPGMPARMRVLARRYREPRIVFIYLFDFDSLSVLAADCFQAMTEAKRAPFFSSLVHHWHQAS